MSSSNIDDLDIEIGPPNEAVAHTLGWRPPSEPWIRFGILVMSTAILVGVLAVGAWGALSGNHRAEAFSESNHRWAFLLEYLVATYYFGAKLFAAIAKAFPKLAGFLPTSSQ